MIDEDELNSSWVIIHIERVLRKAMRKHIHFVLILSAIIMATGIVSVSLLPNIYSATTTVLVDPQKIPERYVASTIDPNAQLNTLAQQVLSSSRLQEIIERYNLYSNLQTSSREEIIDYMRSKTKIDIKSSLEPEQGLSSFSITYENTDRAIVAVVTNQLAASFIEWNLKVRQQQALGTTEFLSSELDEAKKSLEEQETALQEYRMQHAGATPDALTGNLQALSRLQAESEANEDAISRLDQERILLSQTSSADPRVAPLTERDRLIQDKRRLESELSELKRQFTDSYPDVISVKGQIKDASARLAAIPESSNTTDRLDSTTKVRLTLIEKELQRHKELKVNLQAQIRSFQGKRRLGTYHGITPGGAYSGNHEVSRQNYQSLLDKNSFSGNVGTTGEEAAGCAIHDSGSCEDSGKAAQTEADASIFGRHGFIDRPSPWSSPCQRSAEWCGQERNAIERTALSPHLCAWYSSSNTEPSGYSSCQVDDSSNERSPDAYVWGTCNFFVKSEANPVSVLLGLHMKSSVYPATAARPVSSEKRIAIHPDPKSRLVFLTEPEGLAVERYRLIRRRLATLHPNGAVVLITSPSPGEGKTLTSINLAWSFAEAGHSTCLVDLDFRAPGISRTLDYHFEEDGVREVLEGKAKIREVICRLGEQSLYVLGIKKRLASPWTPPVLFRVNGSHGGRASNHVQMGDYRFFSCYSNG